MSEKELTLDEILALDDVNEKIELLKKGRKTPQPDTADNLKAWDSKKHEVNNRPAVTVRFKSDELDEDGRPTGKTKFTTETKDVNKIAIPFEQEVCNKRASMTFGLEPKIYIESDDESEKDVFSIVKSIDKSNKFIYQNKKVSRAYNSEQEVCEYYYSIEDPRFFESVKKKLTNKTNIQSTKKILSTIWSPFQGDVLYPYFDRYNNYKGIGREFKVVNGDDTTDYFMFVSDTKVFQWVQKDGKWVTDVYLDPNGQEKQYPFAHGFSKNPTNYVYKKETLCKKVQPLRERFEKLISAYADCIDYNFAPLLAAVGSLIQGDPRGSRGGLIELEDGGDMKYITWQQAPDTIKLEMDNIINLMYQQTNTPRTTLENIKGTGNALSGVAFRLAFMDSHMAVANDAEDLELFLQRRYNFLVSAVGDLYTPFKQASDRTTIDVEIQPYMIDNDADNIKMAVDGLQGGVLSLDTAIIIANMVDKDKIQEEADKINAQSQKANEVAQFPYN